MEKKYLNYQELHAQYGIGRKAVNGLVYARKLRRSKVGNAWRYPVADLERIFTPRTGVAEC